MAATTAIAFSHNPSYTETLRAQEEKEEEEEEDDIPQLRKSCDYCVRMKRGCNGGSPCELCSRRNKECIRSVKKRSGPAKGTKYCKRKPRKNPKISTPPSSSCSSAAAGGGAIAAPTASTPSGGPSNTPAGGGGRKKTATKGRPLASSLSRKFKREAADASVSDRRKKGVKKSKSSSSSAAAVARNHGPSSSAVTSPGSGVGAAAAVAAAAAAAAAAAVPVEASPSARWSGGGGNKIKPELIGGAGGTVDADRRGSYGALSAASDAFGSRRGSSCLTAFGMMDAAGDRRHVIEAGDSCSGSLMPFYFGGDGGGGGDIGVDRDAEGWEDDGGVACGGGGRAADYGYSGGGNAEAEHQARMMPAAAAGQRDLDEALYGPCHKRASFHAWGSSSFDTARHSNHPHHYNHNHNNHHHHSSSSAEGLAWNQLLQQADAPPPTTAQGGHGGSLETHGEPAGGLRLPPSLPSSSSFGSHLHHHQLAAAAAAAAAAADAKAAGGGEMSGGVDGGSNMPSLRDLLLDRPSPPQEAPASGELSMAD